MNEKKCSERIDISAESILMQLPGYICVRGLESNFLFGNTKVAELAGLQSAKKLEGFSDFNAPWCNISQSLKQGVTYHKALNSMISIHMMVCIISS